MDNTIIVALITLCGSIVTAVIAAWATIKSARLKESTPVSAVQTGAGVQHGGTSDVEKQGFPVGRAILWIIAGVFAVGFVGNLQRSADVPPPAMGYFCYDSFGNRRCQLITPQPIGAPCWCPGQGAGVVGP